MTWFKRISGSESIWTGREIRTRSDTLANAVTGLQRISRRIWMRSHMIVWLTRLTSNDLSGRMVWTVLRLWKQSRLLKTWRYTNYSWGIDSTNPEKECLFTEAKSSIQYEGDWIWNRTTHDVNDIRNETQIWRSRALIVFIAHEVTQKLNSSPLVTIWMILAMKQKYNTIAGFIIFL